MAPKTAAELAANNPLLKAMLMELGSARVDDFPMEDGEGGRRGRDTRTDNHPIAPVVVPKKQINSAWAEAMQRGDFDDEDAAQVSGMDSMADGQLARARRCVPLGPSASRNHNCNSDIRPDRNGHVPPRATPGKNDRRNMPGPVHVGDGPINIGAVLLSGGKARRPLPPNLGPKRTEVSREAFARSPSPRVPTPRVPTTVQPAQPPPVRPRSCVTQPVNAKINRVNRAALAQSDAAKPQDQTSGGAQPDTQGQACIVLPDGASVVLKLPASLGATAFPEKSQKYSGEVYLVSASQPSEDILILTVPDKDIPEIRHPISEYDTYMSVSNTGLMLKFVSRIHGFNFYGLDFENVTGLNLFIQTLQKLVERPKQQAEGAVVESAVKDMSTTSGTVVPAETAQPTFVVPAEKVTPTLTNISKAADIVEQRPSDVVREQQACKDKKARQTVELQTKKQSDDVEEAAKAPKPLKNEPGITGQSLSEDPAAGRRLSPSKVVQTFLNPSNDPPTAYKTPTLKHDEPESGTASMIRAAPSTAISVQLQPVQAVKAPAQQTHDTPKVDLQLSERIPPQATQAASAPVQQSQVPGDVGNEVIQDIIDWAWDTAKYMRDSESEDFNFDTIRVIIRATSAASLGRWSPSFSQLSVADQKRLIEGYVRPQVERGLLLKLAQDDPRVAGLATTEARQTGPSQQQLRNAQDSPEAREAEPSKPRGQVYNIEEMMSLRNEATVFDAGMLPEISRLSPQPSIRRPSSNFHRNPVHEPVEQGAATNPDSLNKYQGLKSPLSDESKSCLTTILVADQGVPSPDNNNNNNNVEALVDFLSPGLTPKPGSPRAGFGGLAHDRGDARLPDQNFSQLQGGSANKSTYQKDLEGLVATGADKGNSAFDQTVVKAIEGFSRLSLN